MNSSWPSDHRMVENKYPWWAFVLPTGGCVSVWLSKTLVENAFGYVYCAGGSSFTTHCTSVMMRLYMAVTLTVLADTVTFGLVTGEPGTS